MSDRLKAPFPWFGGKSRVAHLVWERFGDVCNYVEPFFGSGAVLLGRPHVPRVETVNDLDCYLSNFWRAIACAPEQVARFADWPVNEADLHARHLWLVNRPGFREHMKTDPDFFDPKIAGWWVWGLSQWIGGGWCAPRPARDRANGAPRRGRSWLSGSGQAVTVPKDGRVRPRLTGGGQGTHRDGVWHRFARGAGKGVHRQLPDLGGVGSSGRGVHSAGLSGLEDYFEALAVRLRRVRVCCGDWSRVLGPTPTTHVGLTAVFLDPPYGAAAGRDPNIYSSDDLQVAAAVAEWARSNGDNPLLRIALCGYDGEHEMPASWSCLAWIAPGGYGARADGNGKRNRSRERIWFSPYCLVPHPELFGAPHGPS